MILHGDDGRGKITECPLMDDGHNARREEDTHREAARIIYRAQDMFLGSKVLCALF